MPTVELDYKEIREIRKLVLDEMSSQFILLSTDHYIIAEMRIQTIIQAKLIAADVGKEQSNWKKNKK